MKGAAQSLDSNLALEMPHKGLGVEHVSSKLDKCGGIGDGEVALEVQVAPAVSKMNILKALKPLFTS